jgi:hypothetical protein
MKYSMVFRGWLSKGAFTCEVSHCTRAIKSAYEAFGTEEIPNLGYGAGNAVAT